MKENFIQVVSLAAFAVITMAALEGAKAYPRNLVYQECLQRKCEGGIKAHLPALLENCYRDLTSSASEGDIKAMCDHLCTGPMGGRLSLDNGKSVCKSPDGTVEG